jgi:hypothetical protein
MKKNVAFFSLFFILLTIILLPSYSYAQTPDPSCKSDVPPTAPDLYQINTTSTKATLFFTPVNDYTTSYVVFYGLKGMNEEMYNATFGGGKSPAALSFDINALSPGKEYVFKVRAENGCAKGPWSNTRSAMTKPDKLPTTGPVDTFPALLTIASGFILAGFILSPRTFFRG